MSRIPEGRRPRSCAALGIIGDMDSRAPERRIVQQKKLSPLGEQRIAVDVSLLAHGSYALHVSDAQRLLVSKVFVKE